jgi:hypothetical protein
MLKEKHCITQFFLLPLSPEGNDTVFVGMVSEFTFPFSNVSFSVCCNCQLRPNRCIAGGEEYKLFKGLLLLTSKANGKHVYNESHM